MNFITTKETLILLASFLVSLLTLYYIWQKRRIKGTNWLIYAIIAIAVDNLCAMARVSSTDLTGDILWSKLQYLGAATSPVFLLLFFINFPHRQFKLNSQSISSLFIIPAICIIFVMTNEYHFLFWSGFEDITGTRNSYVFLHGPVFWVTQFYSYLCGVIVIGMIIRNVFKSSGFLRRQSIVMLISSFFPFMAGLLYIFDLNPMPSLDLLSIGYSISGLGMVISIMFLHMFELLPISRSLLVENLQDGVIVIDKELRIIDINPSAKQMLENNSLKPGDSIEKIERKDFFNAINQKERQIEVQLNNHRHQTLQFIPTPLTDENGNTAGSMIVIRDLTEIRNVELALHQSEERYRSLINDVINISSIGMCILDKNFHIVWVNQAAVDYWRIHMVNIIGNDIRELLRSIDTEAIENSKEVIAKINSAFENGEFIKDMKIHFLADGMDGENWLMYNSKPIRVGYYAGGRIEQYINITEIEILQKKIELLAVTDELTGIYNRRGLFELGFHDFKRARRSGSTLSVIYVDIDRFKKLNDSYGHAKGDLALIELVERIQSNLRDMDIFGRYGGDEFVIIVPDANITQALEIAERIRTCIRSSPFMVNGDEIYLESSIGIAQINPDDNFASLLDRADHFMYRAKQKGFNQIEIEEHT